MTRGLALWLVAGLLFAASASADVPPGFDLFETDPEGTVFSFREEFSIPPNFFDEGSAPFQGDVRFGGLPIVNFEGRDVGDADTIFRRTQQVALAPPFPASGSTPIELVALNLQAIQPIRVDVRGSQQVWDVAATRSDAMPTSGQLDITQTGDAGGTYASQAAVFPRFTFTRLGDGATRVLDTGEMFQQAGGSERIRMFIDLSQGSQGTPWRVMCVPPALPVLGLNDGFCPGLDPASGEIAEADRVGRLTRQRLLPAQPRLEHFSCYAISVRRGFRRRTVGLRDQFGEARARVARPSALCAPARKNDEPLVNRRAHLQCSLIRTSGFSERSVAVRNQFGSAEFDVLRRVSLCTPSAASRRGRPRPLGLENQVDHFTCYEILPRVGMTPDPIRAVAAVDQFGRRALRQLVPRRLCAPTRKNDEPLLHPVPHLVCYQVAKPSRVRPRRARTRNQFGSGRVTVRRYANFCVPSLKVPL